MKTIFLLVLSLWILSSMFGGCRNRCHQERPAYQPGYQPVYQPTYQVQPAYQAQPSYEMQQPRVIRAYVEY